MVDIPVASEPSLHRAQDTEGNPRLELHGAWNLRAMQGKFTTLIHDLAEAGRDPHLTWDLLDVDILDDAGGALLWRMWGQKRPARIALKPEHETVFAELAALPPRKLRRARADIYSPALALGNAMLFLSSHILGLVTLAGQVAIDSARLFGHPDKIPWREISANVHRNGGQAMSITALVGFLVGITLSYLSAKQLQLFGADIFFINVLGIGIVRELGPMLAAVLVAGRSGSAMTAQLGVMRVTQELDVMSVMGIPHTVRLVLPKIIALAVTMPLLILWTTSIALIGSMLAANWQLGIGYRQFLNNLPDVVPVANLWLGIGKGAVFGVLIALVACHFGLRIKPNTESLGAGTTESVVTAITSVIVVDAIFAVFFSEVGLEVGL
jgi:phospholipid/cholesterol/gamma-HCH transport system permease protein